MAGALQRSVRFLKCIDISPACFPTVNIYCSAICEVFMKWQRCMYRMLRQLTSRKNYELAHRFEASQQTCICHLTYLRIGSLNIKNWNHATKLCLPYPAACAESRYLDSITSLLTSILLHHSRRLLCANIKLDTIEACVAKYEMAFLLFFFGRPTASSLFFGQVVYTGYWGFK